MAIKIQIFRAGKHVAMSGEVVNLSESDVAQIAASYDPALHEAPVVVGHPKHNRPAYAWTRALAVTGGVLEADIDQIDPAFAEAVKAKRYKKISASLYQPDSPSNPKPGSYYLRHVGFLGAVPPGVKGLREASFAENEPGVLEFADIDAAALFRSLREFLIGKFGLEETEKALPSYLVDWVQKDAAIEAAKTGTSFAEPDVAAAVVTAVTAAAGKGITESVLTALPGALVPALTESLSAAFTDVEPEKLKAAIEAGVVKALAPTGEGDQATTAVGTAVDAGLAKLAAPIEEAVRASAVEAAPANLAEPPPAPAPRTAAEREREKKLAERERGLVEAERKQRRDLFVSFLESLAKDGRRLGVQREHALELLELVATSPVSFGEGKDQTRPVEVLKRLLQRLPKEVHFSELGGADEFGEDSDPSAVARAAQEYQAARAKDGVHVSTRDAVNHVTGRR